MKTEDYELYTDLCPQVLFSLTFIIAPILWMLLGLADRVTSIIGHAGKHKKFTLAVIILCLTIYYVYPAKLLMLIIFYRCMFSHYLLSDPDNMWDHFVGRNPYNPHRPTEEEKKLAMDYYNKVHLVHVIIQLLLAICFYYI